MDSECDFLDDKDHNGNEDLDARGIDVRVDCDVGDTRD